MTDSAGRAGARIGVDVGGTFTDIALEYGARRHTTKVPTTHRAPEDGVLEGVLSALGRAGLDAPAIDLIIHGTTLATNAVIERRGARAALLTTEGFRDVIDMGTESRFEQYDLDIVKPSPLVPRRFRFGVPERLGPRGEILLPLDERAIFAIADRLVAEGIESVAVGFMHSYVNPAHELRAAELLAERMPGIGISLSSEVSPEIREYERFSTTCANAYVQPLIDGYIGRLESRLHAAGFHCPLFMMLSNGGIAEPAIARRFPVRLIESGPAGGAILAAHIARRIGLPRVVSFDMGGTTAKICLIDDAKPQTSRSFEVARGYRFKPGSGLPVRIPVVEMVEIGAGGGSIAALDPLGRITVGPEATGSEPGPACYDRGGDRPTVTDADVVLGRIAPEGFAGGAIRLDTARAERALRDHIGARLGHSAEFAAWGITEIVDENMANAAREHATENGKSLDGRSMIAFGGSAPIHAARLAEKVGIERIVVPVSAGVGSAVGFLRAPVSYEVSRTAYQRLSAFDPVYVNRILAGMAAEARAVVARGAPDPEPRELRLAYMRYVGQGHEIPVPVPAIELDRRDAETLRAAYDETYREKYGRVIDGIDVEIMSWTVAVTAAVPRIDQRPAPATAHAPSPAAHRDAFDPATGAPARIPVYRRAELAPGAKIGGPAFITEDETTTAVSAAFVAEISADGDIIMQRKAETNTPAL